MQSGTNRAADFLPRGLAVKFTINKAGRFRVKQNCPDGLALFKKCANMNLHAMARLLKTYPDKKCAFASCGVVFTPTRSWQAYHTRECQQLSYIDRSRSKPNARLMDLERRVSDLEKIVSQRG